MSFNLLYFYKKTTYYFLKSVSSKSQSNRKIIAGATFPYQIS